jgi:succinoglycan biosynthesis protein ExoA
MTHVPFVTVAVPTLNESATIAAVISELLSGADDLDLEIVVVDGGSADGTQALVSEMSEGDPRVRLLHNPGRIQSRGVNLVSRSADPRSKILVRADAHCAYPAGFVARVATTLATTGAQSVVVPLFTIGEDETFQQSVAEAQNSKLGNGGAAHRGGWTPSGWVDHGHHAAFDLPTFLSLGGYDETFAVNEDAEYDVRLAKSGGRVWMERGAEINYYPRRTAASLARQYFRYGQGRSRTVFKHSIRPRLRQMAPLAIFWAMALSILLAPVSPLLAIPGAAYLAACLAYSLKTAKGSATGMFVALCCMHLSWGAGFSYGAARAVAGLSPHRHEAEPAIG